jgi:hypothetical protein
MSKQHKNNRHDQSEDGPMSLSHEAVEGYRPVFYVCIILGTLYLAFVLWQTL